MFKINGFSGVDLWLVVHRFKEIFGLRACRNKWGIHLYGCLHLQAEWLQPHSRITARNLPAVVGTFAAGIHSHSSGGEGGGGSVFVETFGRTYTQLKEQRTSTKFLLMKRQWFAAKWLRQDITAEWMEFRASYVVYTYIYSLYMYSNNSMEIEVGVTWTFFLC